MMAPLPNGGRISKLEQRSRSRVLFTDGKYMKRLNIIRCLIDFLGKPQQSIPTDEVTVSEETADLVDGCKDYTTLGDLARSGHSFFRFSQSQPGRSFEKVYAEYIPGKITEAKDEDKLLSFVTEETIAVCFMYGDTLTSLKFDLNDEEFKKIADTPFKYLGHSLGEYESKYLLVDNNYSLADVGTIVKLFDYVTSTRQLGVIFKFPCGSLDERLHNFGYYESEKLVKYIKQKFEEDINISPDKIRELIKQYLKDR